MIDLLAIKWLGLTLVVFWLALLVEGVMIVLNRRYLMDILEKVDLLLNGMATRQHCLEKTVELNVQQTNKIMAALDKLVEGLGKLAGVDYCAKKKP